MLVLRTLLPVHLIGWMCLLALILLYTLSVLVRWAREMKFGQHSLLCKLHAVSRNIKGCAIVCYDFESHCDADSAVKGNPYDEMHSQIVNGSPFAFRMLVK